jgi:hypothetical protein
MFAMASESASSVSDAETYHAGGRRIDRHDAVGHVANSSTLKRQRPERLSDLG